MSNQQLQASSELKPQPSNISPSNEELPKEYNLKDKEVEEDTVSAITWYCLNFLHENSCIPPYSDTYTLLNGRLAWYEYFHAYV